MSGVVAARLAARWDVPHVAMFHTLGEVKNRARSASTSRRRASRRSARSRRRPTASSSRAQHEKHLLTALYGADAERIAVVPCGVDLDLFAPMDKEFARRELGLTRRRARHPLRRPHRAAEGHRHPDQRGGAAARGRELHRADRRRRRARGGARSTSCARRRRRLGIDHHISFVGAVEHRRAAAVLQRRRRLRRAVVLRELRAGRGGVDGVRHAGRRVARRRADERRSATARPATSSRGAARSRSPSGWSCCWTTTSCARRSGAPGGRRSSASAGGTWRTRSRSCTSRCWGLAAAVG